MNDEMQFTGERFVPTMGGQIAYEHLHRYASVAELCSGRRVLDIASGEGFGSAYLARTAASVVGIDVDADSVAHASRKYQRQNLRFMDGNATSLPLEAGSIDVVISFETLEHFREHDAFLAEVKRVLAPDGVLVVSSPNRTIYSERAGFANPFHVAELTFDEFSILLRRYFWNVAIFGQQIVALSILHPVAGYSPSPWFVRDGEAIGPSLTALPDPTYFIGACSNTMQTVNLSSGYLDVRDPLLLQLHLETEELRRRVRSLETT